MTVATGTRLGRYEIRAQLGAGGMGEVYLAEDTQLGRRVAIKFLSPELVADERANKRLVKEARAAATLDHPNICSIYEVGEADGRSFIVMQYLEGETLDARIKSKPLRLKESLTIAAQIADALAEAHSHGIIHRDIKPGNIMITSRGQAKVMDFGLARVIAGAVESEAETQSLLTTPGTIMGTMPYMSPEQVRGEVLDGRTDIFSFGVVLYEMLSGRQPFASESAAATISAILNEEPPTLLRYAPDLPEELQRIARKCLEKDRERRYQTIRDVAIDLDNCRREHETAQATVSRGERMTGGVAATTAASDVSKHKSFFSRRALIAGALLVLLVGVTLAYLLVFRRAATTVRSPKITSLAVLPLSNLSGEPAQEYFADGMTEALISNLAQIRALTVISRISAMHYKGSNKLLPEIARELNVDAVIVGSVQKSGGRVRVTAQLIHAATDTNLWAREYERDLTDVLKLESEVARAVADEIRIQVTADERARLAAARSVNPQAHEACLLGRYHLAKLNEDDLKLAIEYFERAIQLAPDYAPAYSGLSDAWRERGIWGGRNLKEVEMPSRTAALKAVELDPGIAEGHSSLSYIKQIYDWDWTGSEREVKRALEIDPGSVAAHQAYAGLLMALGRHSEAIKEIQTAEQLDPLSSLVQSTFGRVLYRARKYEEAVPHLKRAIELDPRNFGAYGRLGDVYVQIGTYDEAIAAFGKVRDLRPDGAYPVRIARVYALMGKGREAMKMVSGTKAGAFETAGVYAALGDRDEAFRILEKAIEARDSLLVYIKEDPSLESLHSDPRWKELLRRMNFPSD